jgi:hypothetical protein
VRPHPVTAGFTQRRQRRTRSQPVASTGVSSLTRPTIREV